MGSLPLPSDTIRQPPTCPISKKSKHPNNSNNNETGQVVIENFFNKLINQEAGPGDVPPACMDDGDYEDYDTQYEDTNALSPAWLVQDRESGAGLWGKENNMNNILNQFQAAPEFYYSTVLHASGHTCNVLG